ncbi:MAG TPA: aminodeoxychorismate synthase component I [Vicinamibacterales bacterium]|nr:aminodeoxychorismate synthase component I [Vicinamibacterales bacterium]
MIAHELLPVPDPVGCCDRLRGVPYRMFLDSARHASPLGRYSFVAADPAAVVRCKGADAGGALDDVRGQLASRSAAAVPGLPPFQTGALGYLAYEWGRTLETLPASRYDDLDLPDVVFGIYDWVIAWDHDASRAWVIARDGANMRRALDLVGDPERGALQGPPVEVRESRERPPSYPVDADWIDPRLGLRSSFTHAGYLDAVNRVRDYIYAGDIFQANLSQRFEAPLVESPWDLYCRLRARNPAPFAAFIELPDFAVLSASPERFMRVDAHGRVETRPIKGTRPRGVGPEHDAALGRALTESAKDRAENLMIVDLIRNDLSRVCAPGSVRVRELFALEHFATVHHLVSTVVGTLSPGLDGLDLLRASFPGGSITGAPKIRAMEIIAELEPSVRGVYCGAIGYLSVTGELDTNIAIRTALARDGRVYLNAGGGIVADSDAEQEYQETFHKARGIIDALVTST